MKSLRHHGLPDFAQRSAVKSYSGDQTRISLGLSARGIQKVISLLHAVIEIIKL